MASIQHWQDLTSPELRAHIQAAGGHLVAVAVVGAIEQHGPHLSLGTDTHIGQGLLATALQHLNSTTQVVIMPPISVGTSDEHADFVGTISLSPEALSGVLSAYGEALHRAGIDRWVIINAHGGNVSVIESVALSMRRRFNMWVAKAYYPKFQPLPNGPDTEELKCGLHGGQLETSLLSAINADQVRPSQAKHFSLKEKPWAGQAPLAWLAQDLHDEGVAGQADRASVEEGHALLAHYGKALAEVIDAMAKNPRPIDPKS